MSSRYDVLHWPVTKSTRIWDEEEGNSGDLNGNEGTYANPTSANIARVEDVVQGSSSDVWPGDDMDPIFADQGAVSEAGEEEERVVEKPEWMRLLGLLVIWLHLVHHLSEEACGTILTFMDAVVLALSDAPSDKTKPIPRSRFKAELRDFGVASSKVMYALCPNKACWTPHILPAKLPSLLPTHCTRCHTSLLADPITGVFAHLLQPEGRHRAKLTFQYEPVTVWLRALLRRPGVLDKCEEWKSRISVEGVYSDLYDGSAWCPRAGDEDFDQVLTLSIMVDWFQPFIRRGSATHSCCVLSLRLDNLPSNLRNRVEYTHVCAVLPGKANASGFHAMLGIVVEEMTRLSTEGFRIYPERSRNSPRVRVHLGHLLADTEARTMIAGFPGHSSKSQFCPWCTSDHSEWVQRTVRGAAFQPRDGDIHRTQSLLALELGNSLSTASPVEQRSITTKLDTIRKQHGATMSSLYNVPGWSSLDMAPVDVMHALDLGVGKHMWCETLLEGGLLDDADLQTTESILQHMTYPHRITRLRPDLGKPSAGTPTAAGWSTLTRYILPVLLVSAWRNILLSTDTKTFITTKSTIPHPKGQSFQKSVSLASIVNASLTLARACRLAHSRTMTVAQITAMHENLVDHVRLISSQIHPAWVTYNFHIVLHLSEHIRKHGPPRTVWSYAQERSYGIMKKIKTNQHRGGELEITLLNKTDDRHRFAAKIESLPPSKMANNLRSLIAGAEKRNRETTTVDLIEDEDGDSDDDDNELDGIYQSARCAYHLSSSDLLRISGIMNEREMAHGRETRFTPFFAHDETSHSSETVLSSMAEKSGTMDVGDYRLRRKTTRFGASSGPSACLIRTSAGLRLARFEAYIKHSYFDPNTRTVSSQGYAIIHEVEALQWPTDRSMRLPLWKELGYVAGKASQSLRRIVGEGDVIGAAITFPGAYIFGTEDSVVAVALTS
ncbi:hypothetical protein CF326_g5220 [Tilletia indica]|nr:hypothetical protein CF326_g5220 [Tilletia indica]